MYSTADYMALVQMLSKSVFISSASCAVYLIYTEMFFQYSLRLYKSGQLARLNPIKFSRSFAPTFLSMFAITFPTSFFYLNFVKASPVQWTYSFNIASATVLTTIFLLIADTFFFHIHYTLHKNKRLFALVHANHHTQKNVTAWSTGVAEFSENLILIAPIWVMYTYFTIFVRGELNIWDYFIPFVTSSYIFVLGHSGFIQTNYKLSLPFPVLFVLIIFGRLFNIRYQRPVDHEIHHVLVHGNYSLFFKHWDSIYRTEKHLKRREKIWMWCTQKNEEILVDG